MIRIYAKTVDYDSFVQDMKQLDSRFVVDGQLIHHSHNWSFTYHGQLVEQVGEYDEDGNEITPPVLSDGDRADLYFVGMQDEILSMLPEGTMTHGTSFSEVQPVTPKTMLMGEPIRVVDSEVDKAEESFEAGKQVQVGKVFTYNDKKYAVRIPHKTQADWTPDAVPALFREVIDELREWSSFQSHEFQNLEVGTAVIDNDTTYYLTAPTQGHWQPSGDQGHHGWSTEKPQ